MTVFINLDVEKFLLSRVGLKLFVIGRSGSGKSTFVKWMFYILRKTIPAAVAISESEIVNDFFSEFIPESFIYNKFDSSILHKIVERQKTIITKKCPKPDILIVADDCFSDVKKMQEPPTPWIFKVGRHYRINYVVVMQYCHDLKPDTRNQVDGVFLFNEQNENTRKALWTCFAASIPYSVFTKLMTICTDNFGIMFINLSSSVSKTDWKEFISKTKAPKTIPPFSFGSVEYQQYAAARVKRSD
jgi:energy-coupling factor transporter ATP-binding protein EcfA2